MVRLHLIVPKGAEVPTDTLDGILTDSVGGWYKLEKASAVRGEEQSLPLEGVQWVPTKSVLWVQEIT